MVVVVEGEPRCRGADVLRPRVRPRAPGRGLRHRLARDRCGGRGRPVAGAHLAPRGRRVGHDAGLGVREPDAGGAHRHRHADPGPGHDRDPELDGRPARSSPTTTASSGRAPWSGTRSRPRTSDRSTPPSRDPPDSTEQIVDLAKWEPREDPMAVDVVDLAGRARRGMERGRDHDDRPGDDRMHARVPRARRSPAPARLGRGWGGDRVVVASGPDDAFAVAWRLVVGLARPMRRSSSTAYTASSKPRLRGLP